MELEIVIPSGSNRTETMMKHVRNNRVFWLLLLHGVHAQGTNQKH